jgi:hypothetical protein
MLTLLTSAPLSTCPSAESAPQYTLPSVLHLG